MKKLLIIFAVVLFTAGFATKVSAQSGIVTVSNDAGGEILAPITLLKGSPLEFGRVGVGITSGTVVITTTPALELSVIASTGLFLVPGGATRSAASFTVGGTAGYSYAITLPNSIPLTGPDGTMSVSDINSLSTNNTASTTGGLLTGGEDVFYVGGTLNVGASQAPGLYSGTFDVSVNYN